MRLHGILRQLDRMKIVSRCGGVAILLLVAMCVMAGREPMASAPTQTPSSFITKSPSGGTHEFIRLDPVPVSAAERTNSRTTQSRDEQNTLRSRTNPSGGEKTAVIAVNCGRMFLEQASQANVAPATDCVMPCAWHSPVLGRAPPTVASTAV